jgi:fused signal recognition particle receptor
LPKFELQNMSFFNRFFNKEKQADLDKGIEKTKESFFTKMSKVIAGKDTVDEEVLDNLEQILISSDVGLETTVKIIEKLEARVARDKYLNSSELDHILKEEISDLLTQNETGELEDFDIPENRPYVIFVVGVNGVGKTTTIGKLANAYQKRGYKVVLGAGDTFRAAAVDQLKIWAERVGCQFYSKGMGADPAAVAYEAVDYAVKNAMDVCIIDTAGRLHNKVNLMNELGKMKKSATKRLEGAPHEVLLVLDATTGQNAIEQAKHFTEIADVTALALTKLDGTAKGGVAIGISDQFNIPIKYLGVGEGIDQLQIFNRKAFVDSLFDHSISEE